MKIRIRNLGVIKEGAIDLSKRINVFCGKNGTGKTYFSYIIYALLRNKIHVSSDNGVVDDLVNNREVTVEIDFERLLTYRKQMTADVVAQVDKVFGISEDVSRGLFSDLCVECLGTIDDLRQEISAAEIGVTMVIQNVRLSIDKSPGESALTVRVVSETIPSEAIGGLRMILYTALYHMLAVYPLAGVAVFPVERNSIYTFSKELSIRKQEALDSLQMLADNEKRISKRDILFSSKRYPLPVKDGLLVADDLSEVSKTSGDFCDFAATIEQELLEGSVKVSREGEIVYTPSQSRRTHLPIHMTASVVKTLSSLVVFLKHNAHKGDTIIIDEPEINLHPDNQVTLARLLARLASKGFRLIVSTHSDYIIREINNMIMLSNTNESTRAKYGYRPEECISEDDIAVHVFCRKRKRDKFVSVEELSINKAGFEVKSIDDTIERQNQIAEALFNTLIEDEEQSV